MKSNLMQYIAPEVEKIEEGKGAYQGEVELAHFNPEEIELLTRLQGGEHRIPEDGNVRSFLPLASLFENPEYVAALKEIVLNLHNNDQGDDYVVPALLEYLANGEQESTKEPEDGAIQVLEAEGGPDPEIALCPKVMLDVLDDIRGYSQRNPNTGLRSYFLPFLVPFMAAALGGTTASALGAGVLGTALAAGAGGYAGSRLQGDKHKDALLYGLGGAALGGLGSALGAAPAAGAAAASKSAAATLLAKPTIGTALGSVLGPVGQGVSALGDVAGLAGSSMGLGAGAGGAGAAGGLGSLLSPGVLLPTALIGGMLYKANKQQKKHEGRYQQELADYEQKRLEGNQAVIDYMNVKPTIKAESRDYTHIAEPDQLAEKYGYQKKHFNYNEGGMVTIRPHDKSGGILGKGDGQDDYIRTSAHPMTQIFDASTTSDLGDGSTEAGFKQLDKLRDYIVNNSELKKGSINVPHQVASKLDSEIPVALSNGEYSLDRYASYVTGDGSPKKAEKVFDTMVRLVREDKRTKGNTLPPKAKPAIEYFKEAKKIEG